MPEWQPHTPIDVFFFDCDSTLTRIEGIDELADMHGVGSQVKAMTERCMETTGLNPEIYHARLDLILPTQQQIALLAELYLNNISNGAKEVIATLKRLGKHVYLISAGIRESLLPLAQYFEIANSHLLAVNVFFNQQGRYVGFDETSELVQQQGKKQLIQSIIKPNQTSLLIGDGLNDWQAHEVVTRFIGYGGVRPRALVKQHAEFFIDADSLLPVLPLSLTAGEVDLLLPEEKQYYEAGSNQMK